MKDIIYSTVIVMLIVFSVCMAMEIKNLRTTVGELTNYAVTVCAKYEVLAGDYAKLRHQMEDGNGSSK